MTTDGGVGKTVTQPSTAANLQFAMDRAPTQSRALDADRSRSGWIIHCEPQASLIRSAQHWEMLDGPIADRAALRQARLLQWSQVIDAERWHPVLRVWLQTRAAVALLKRLPTVEV
jgi:hypothetical protein